MEFINTHANLGQYGIDGAIYTGNNNVFFDSPEFSDGSEWFSKGSQILGPPHSTILKKSSTKMLQRCEINKRVNVIFHF